MAWSAYRRSFKGTDNNLPTAAVRNAGRLDAQRLTILRCTLAMPADAPVWQHKWLRLQLVIRELLTTRWDAKSWPMAKAELRKALSLQRRLQRAAWWN